MRSTFAHRVGKAAAALAATALALAGCSASTGTEPTAASGDGAAPAEQVALTLGWWGGDARHQRTQEAIAKFEELHPNVTVEPQYADWNGYWDQLATLTAAGDAPDVIQMGELHIASYADRGALLDLSTLRLDTSGFSEEVLATGQSQGVQYGLPVGQSLFGLIANVTLFQKYGVDLPDDEAWTWDDYADLAVELTEKSGGEITGSAQIGGWDTHGLKYWSRAAGSELFDAQGSFALDPQVLVDLWQFQLDLVDRGGLQTPAEIVESQAAGISANSFSSGKVALAVAPDAQVAAYTASTGDEVQLLKLPEPEEIHPAALTPTMYWSVSSTTAHPAEAAALVDFLLNSEEAAAILETERGVPANADMRGFLAGRLSEADAKVVAFQERVTPGPAAPIPPNGSSNIEVSLQRYTQAVFAGQQEPLAAAKGFVAEVQSEIDAAR